MADNPSITLYTSIPLKLHRMAGGVEYGDVYQKECINSWLSAGFRVVSINRRANVDSMCYPSQPSIRWPNCRGTAKECTARR